jgi:ABC-2 type transport system ATP-binding protein
MFDEPMNGLDPEGFLWIRALLRDLANDGRAVLVSSHLMSELEGSADHVVVIGRGRLVAEAPVGELIDLASGDRVMLRAASQSQAMTALADAGATVAANDHDRIAVNGLSAERVIAVLSHAGIGISEVAAYRASLEEAYLELTKASAEYSAAPAAGGSDA